MRLHDKVIAITGGASGIGGATAVVCAREGARVVIGDISPADGREIVKKIIGAGGEAIFVQTDVTQDADAARLIEQAESSFGRLDVLVTCAGILQGAMVLVENFEETTWDRVLDVNLKGTFLCVKHAVPAIKRAGGGVILFVSSVAGVIRGSSSVAYGASKGGVHGFGLTLMELAGESIRVNVVCPGSIDTPLKRTAIADIAEMAGESREDAVSRERPGLGDPEGIGKILAFLASDDADFVRGTVFTR